MFTHKTIDKYTGAQLYHLFKTFKEEEGEKFDISLNQLVQEADSHSIRQTGQEYAAQNPQCIFHNPTYKSKQYRLDLDRCRHYLKEEFIEVIDFVDEETETDDEGSSGY